jgi:hypothetical protein
MKRYLEGQALSSVGQQEAGILLKVFALKWGSAGPPFAIENPGLAEWKPAMYTG